MLTMATCDVINANYTFSSAKAQEVLGYHPVYTLEEGVKQTCDYYQSSLLPQKNKDKDA